MLGMTCRVGTRTHSVSAFRYREPAGPLLTVFSVKRFEFRLDFMITLPLCRFTKASVIFPDLNLGEASCSDNVKETEESEQTVIWIGKVLRMVLKNQSVPNEQASTAG